MPRDSTAAAAALALWAVSEGELMRDGGEARGGGGVQGRSVLHIGRAHARSGHPLDDGHSYERSAIEAWFARESEAAAAASTAGATTGAQATPGAGAGSSPPGASTASAPRHDGAVDAGAKPVDEYAAAEVCRIPLSARCLCSHPPPRPPSPPNPTARFAVQRRACLKSRPANRFVTMARTSWFCAPMSSICWRATSTAREELVRLGFLPHTGGECVPDPPTGDHTSGCAPSAREESTGRSATREKKPAAIPNAPPQTPAARRRESVCTPARAPRGRRRRHCRLGLQPSNCHPAATPAPSLPPPTGRGRLCCERGGSPVREHRHLVPRIASASSPPYEGRAASSPS